MDDSLGVWKGSKKELEEKVKKMEDKEKGIKLKLGIDVNTIIVWVYMRIY